MSPLPFLYLALGDLENARACFEEWAEAEPESEAGYLGLILIHEVLGNDSIVAENLAKLETSEHVEFLAAAYARLGRHEEALDVLEAHIAPPREFGPLGMREDPLYGDIRNHPRFAGLLRQQGTGEDQVAAIGIDELFPGPGLPPKIPVNPP